MRLPNITAEAVLRTNLTRPYLTPPAERSHATVRPATAFGECMRSCIMSGADGCGPFCRCVTSGGRNCPVLF
jgi:hypothetical protein